jgi:hypothetical protein
MKKPTLNEWMDAANLDREVVWDAQMDEAYARFVAMSECYLFEDNYEPFETINPKQVNRS